MDGSKNLSVLDRTKWWRLLCRITAKFAKYSDHSSGDL